MNALLESSKPVVDEADEKLDLKDGRAARREERPACGSFALNFVP